jgi:hypothetical protein
MTDLEYTGTPFFTIQTQQKYSTSGPQSKPKDFHPSPGFFLNGDTDGPNFICDKIDKNWDQKHPLTPRPQSL